MENRYSYSILCCGIIYYCRNIQINIYVPNPDQILNKFISGLIEKQKILRKKKDIRNGWAIGLLFSGPPSPPHLPVDTLRHSQFPSTVLLEQPPPGCLLASPISRLPLHGFILHGAASSSPRLLLHGALPLWPLPLPSVLPSWWHHLRARSGRENRAEGRQNRTIWTPRGNIRWIHTPNDPFCSSNLVFPSFLRH